MILGNPNVIFLTAIEAIAYEDRGRASRLLRELADEIDSGAPLPRLKVGEISASMNRRRTTKYKERTPG